jgi:long-chain acyl-CoA synthetase
MNVESLQQLFVEVCSENSNRPAVIGPDGRVATYEELAARVSVVEVLLEQLGVEPGDRVALLLSNSLGFVASYFGALSAGAVVVPMNAGYQKNELLYFLECCGTKVLITTRGHEELCREVVRAKELPVQLLFVEDGLSYSTPVPHLASLVKSPGDGAPAMYQFSSGSTGRPKQIARTHQNLLFELQSLHRTLEMTREDRFLGVAPFSHVNGLVRSMLGSMTCGAALYPLPRFERQVVADTVCGGHLTVFIGVPFQFAMLAKARFRENPDFSSLRLCVSASAPLPRAINELFHQRFGTYVRQLYGSTETGTISVNVEQDPAPHIDTVGTPIFGVDVEVFLEDGRVAAPGELGEFAVNSPGAIRSYVAAEAATRESFRDSWFLTGDLGRRDPRGLLTIAGRKKFFINKGGYKIDPKEIENVLEGHPDVDEAVVIGVPTNYGDERVTAVVVATADLSPADIIEFCQGKVAPFKVPSVVKFEDSIPKSPTGKVRRAMLYPGQ